MPKRRAVGIAALAILTMGLGTACGFTDATGSTPAPLVSVPETSPSTPQPTPEDSTPEATPVETTPEAAPAETQAVQPLVQQPEQQPAQADAYYKSCAAARAAGVAPLHVGDPGYRKGLDRDGDGVACE